MKICTDCYADNSQNANECRRCGLRLDCNQEGEKEDSFIIHIRGCHNDRSLTRGEATLEFTDFRLKGFMLQGYERNGHLNIEITYPTCIEFSNNSKRYALAQCLARGFRGQCIKKGKGEQIFTEIVSHDD